MKASELVFSVFSLAIIRRSFSCAENLIIHVPDIV